MITAMPLYNGALAGTIRLLQRVQKRCSSDRVPSEKKTIRRQATASQAALVVISPRIIVSIRRWQPRSRSGTLLHHSTWNCCDRRTRFVVIWKYLCFILSTDLSTGTKIRIDSVMRPRSSSRGRNTSASVTVTVTPATT